MSQDLNKLFKQIQKNSEEMGLNAMREAAGKALELAKEKSASCLKKYYEKKPKIYKRTHILRKAIRASKLLEKESKGNYTISFFILYDSSRLNGEYKSNSSLHKSGEKWISRYDNPDKFDFKSGSNGIPDSGWILDNYLKGIHPGWYNGEDYGWSDKENTAETMKQFFEKDLHEKAGQLIYESMQGAILNFLKTNGGGK